MQTFLQLLHVAAATILVGPLLLAPFLGLRGIRRRDVDEIRQATRWTAMFGAGTVVVFLLGVATTATSKEYSFRTTWITVSMTLYVVAMFLVYVWAVPALRRAARMVEGGVLDQPAPTEPEEPDPTVTATGPQLATKAQLDSASGVVGAAAAVLAILFLVVTTLMVVKPFGK